MFCSKCGKTLPLEAKNCPWCNQIVGESRFEGSAYTSAQAHIVPGSEVETPEAQAEIAQAPAAHDYTRTTYTSAGDVEQTGDADARTTYRPVFEGTSAPEDIRKDMKEAINGPAEVHAEIPFEELSEEARQTIDAMDEQLKLDEIDKSRFRARPIKSVGQTGISSDVSEYIQKLEANESRRPSRRKREVYDEYVDDAAAAAPAVDGEEQPEVFDDIDEEEFEELRHSSFGVKDIIKVAVALVLVAALFVGGVIWFRYIRGTTSSAPIENVSEELYNNGIALVKQHAETSYAEGILQAYAAEGGGLTALAVKLQESADAVDALLPAEATENEKLFVEALKTIEGNIANCITSDALAVSQNDAEAMAESDDRWTVVTNSIAVLEAAEQAAALTAIINGEQVDVYEVKAEVTPTPTPAVNYNTLSKGSKSDEVLDMQNRLYQLGFFLDDRDGDFGSKTQTAVKMFQQAAGLRIGGIADNETLNAMYSDTAPRTEYAQPTPTPAPTATPAPTEAPEASNGEANQ